MKNGTYSCELFIFSHSIKYYFKINSMRPLSKPQIILSLFCVWSINEPICVWKKICCVFFSLTVFITNICGLIASAVFFHKFVSVNLEMSLYAIFPVFGFLISSYVIVFMCISRHKLATLFDKLTQIYDASK